MCARRTRATAWTRAGNETRRTWLRPAVARSGAPRTSLGCAASPPSGQLILPAGETRPLGIGEVEAVPWDAKPVRQPSERAKERDAGHGDRQPFEQGIRTEVELPDLVSVAALLREQLLDPPDRVAVRVDHRSSEELLDVDVAHLTLRGSSGRRGRAANVRRGRARRDWRRRRSGRRGRLPARATTES